MIEEWFIMLIVVKNGEVMVDNSCIVFINQQLYVYGLHVITVVDDITKSLPN